MANLVRIRSLDQEHDLKNVIIPVDKKSYLDNAKRISISGLTDFIMSGFTGSTMIYKHSGYTTAQVGGIPIGFDMGITGRTIQELFDIIFYSGVPPTTTTTTTPAPTTTTTTTPAPTTTTTTTFSVITWNVGIESNIGMPCYKTTNNSLYTNGIYSSSPLTIPCFYENVGLTIKYVPGIDVIGYVLSPSTDIIYYANIDIIGNISNHNTCSPARIQIRNNSSNTIINNVKLTGTFIGGSFPADPGESFDVDTTDFGSKTLTIEYEQNVYDEYIAVIDYCKSTTDASPFQYPTSISVNPGDVITIFIQNYCPFL